MSRKLRSIGVSTKTDDSSASIGKRYSRYVILVPQNIEQLLTYVSRNDELGTPLGITVDFQSVKDGSFTLRDRDSTRQVRADEARILTAIKELAEGTKVWADIEKELPAFEGQDADVPIR